jgi:hypothetical protein
VDREIKENLVEASLSSRGSTRSNDEVVQPPATEKLISFFGMASELAVRRNGKNTDVGEVSRSTELEASDYSALRSSGMTMHGNKLHHVTTIT